MTATERVWNERMGMYLDVIVSGDPSNRPATTGSEMSTPPAANRLAKCIGCGAPAASMNSSFGPTCPGCYDDYSG